MAPSDIGDDYAYVEEMIAGSKATAAPKVAKDTAPAATLKETARSAGKSQADLLNEVIADSARAGEAMSDKTAMLYAERGMVSGRSANVLETAAQASAKIMEATTNAALTAQEEVNATAKNIGATGETRAKFERNLGASYIETTETLGEVERLVKEGGFFEKLFKLPSALDRLKVAEYKLKTNSAIVADMDSKLTNAGTQARANADSLNVDSAANAATVAAATATVAANELRRTVISDNIEAIKTVRAGNESQVAAMVKQYEVSRGESADIRAKTIHDLQVHEFGKNDRNDQITYDYYMLGRAAAGLPADSNMSPALLSQMMRNPATRGKLELAVGIGLNSRAAGVSTLGNTAGEAALTLRATNGNFSGKPAEGMLKELAALSTRVANVTTNKGKKPSELIEPINAVIANELNKPNSDDSVFTKSPPLAILAKHAPLTQTKFFQVAMSPSVVASPNIAPTFDALLTLGMDKINSNELSQSELVEGISAYYKAVAAENTATGFLLGLPAQKKFNVRIPSLSLFGGADSVDALNTPVLQNALVPYFLAQAKKKSDKFIEDFSNRPSTKVGDFNE